MSLSFRDSDPPRYAVRRTKRTYSPDTKAALLAACREPGASIAAVASAHGMNANVLHRWLKDSARSEQTMDSGACMGATTIKVAEPHLPAFMPVPLSAQPSRPEEREIKVEVREGNLVMNVT